MIDFFTYAFTFKAILAGSVIALTCALLGVFLVLRKLSLLGDGLAHVSFGALALGLFLGIFPFYVAVPVVVLGALVIMFVSNRAKIYGDAAIGVISAFGISAGVILVSLSKGLNVDLLSYLFGNILAVSRIEIYAAILLFIIVLIFLLLFFEELSLLTFDREAAKLAGLKVERLELMLIILAAITVVLAIKVVGVMLVSALLIVPAVSSLQVSRSLKSSLIISSILSVLAVILGIFLSFIFDLPTGAVIVILSLLGLSLTFVYRKYFAD